MEELEVSYVDRCVVIKMARGENRFNPAFFEALNKALDKAESYEDAKCVVTIGAGKHYCLGLDLEYLAGCSPMESFAFAETLQKLMLRILTFPLVTVAAVNGHVYAGGVFLAIAQDHMIMRSEKGWFRLSEVHIKRNFSAGFLEIAKARLPQPQYHSAIILGTKYTAEEALAAQIINEVCPMDQLLDRAIAAGQRLSGEDGLDRRTLTAIKRDTYRDACKALQEPTRFYSNL